MSKKKKTQRNLTHYVLITHFCLAYPHIFTETDGFAGEHYDSNVKPETFYRCYLTG